MRTELTRIPQAAVTDRAALDALLDEVLVAHVGLSADDHPVVLPTAVVRDGDRVLIHGSTGSRWMRLLADGAPASVAITAVDGLIVARSAFESSVRYRSAVLFGRFTAVTGPTKAQDQELVTDALVPGRSLEVRAPTARELAATLLLEMPIERWSMKISDGWPEDPQDDVAGPAWAGVVPMRMTYGAAEPAPDLGPGRPIPPSVEAFGRAEQAPGRLRPVMPVDIAPPAARYAHGVLAERAEAWLHTSGVVPVASDGTVPAGVAAQAGVVWANIAAILTDAGMTAADIVSVTTYVHVDAMDGGLGQAMTARDAFLDGRLVASTLVTVPALAQPSWLIEIAVVAAR